MQTWVVLVTLLELGICGQLPSDFKRCKRSDANFNECLRDAIQDAFPKLANGIKELSVPALEPLNVPSATIGQGSGPVNVEQKYKNVNIYNVITSKLEKLEASTGDKLIIRAQISAPEYVLKADYDFNGRILLLPIVGTGKCTIRLSDVTSELDIMGEKIEKKGKTYIEIKEFKVTLKPAKVQFDFENLFNGDKRLAEDMHKVLNENWKEVFEDVRFGYEELIGSVGKLIANNIFTKVPYSEIFLE